MAFWNKNRKSKGSSGSPGTGADPGHIKKNTIGSSNEISFSVLHAISNSAKGKNAEPSTPLSPKTLNSKNKLPGKVGDTVTQPKWTYSQQEIDSRKSQRRKAKGFAIATGVLIGCAALVAVGFFAVQAIRHQLDFIGQLNEQVGIILEQEESLSLFDECVQRIVDEPLSNLDAFAQNQTQILQKPVTDLARDRLNSAKDQILLLQDHLVTPADKERSNNAISAVNAQLNLLEIGQSLIQWSYDYEQEYADAQAFLVKLLEADGLAREAASTSTQPSRETIAASMEKSQQALAAFNDAQAMIVNLRDATGLETLQPFVDYTALRVQAQEHALDADQAYLDVSSSRLIAANNAYNTAEADAAKLMADQNGLYPADIIETTFEEARAANPDIESWRSELARSNDYLRLLS